MTDYFALLQQPRQPWLEPEELKQKYQELTLAAHPDRKAADESSVDFATVNKAYRVLADPKLRLQHLLQLQGDDANAAEQSIPQELLDLFSRVGNFVQTTDPLLQRAGLAHNALAKSLLQSEILTSRKEATEILEKTRQLFNEAIEETRSLNESWAEEPEKIVGLFRRFAYLTRWIQQVEERQFQLSVSS
jgi:curved DNA-binding protein CbpA